MKSKDLLVNVIAMFVIALVTMYSFAGIAWSLHGAEMRYGGKGYVTDEVWYVSAARVILQKIFNGRPISVDGSGATVVFNSTTCAGKWSSLKPLLISMARTLNLSIRVDYEKLYAVYVNGSRQSIEVYLEKTRGLCPVVDVIEGWMMPDQGGINGYVNIEHPPLGKYLIALSMMLLGDTPLYWRIPIIVAGVATSLLVYLVVKRSCGKWYVALGAALLFALDPMPRALFAVALLDGFVALFATVSLYLAIRRKYIEALIAATVGGLFKATGLFTTIPAIILLSREIARKADRKPVMFIKFLIAYFLLTVALYFLLLVVVSAPLIAYMGIYGWFNNAVVGALRWHLSVKCTGAQCPVSSAPWEWFMGLNSFLIYVYPDGSRLYARGFYPLWFTSLILLVLHLPVVRRGFGNYGHTSLFYLGTFIGYVAIWILGARTQYSFYAIHLAPLVYANLFITLYLFKQPDFTRDALKEWGSLATKVINLALE